MARKAAELFRENLRYANGEPVKVVISDTTIGRAGKPYCVMLSLKRKVFQ